MGEELVAEGRQVQRRRHPHFRTPEPAVELFSHISAYYQNQKLLVQTPSSLSHLSPPSIESARLVIEMALSERRKKLNEMESKALLAAFRIPIAQTVVARSATEAMVLAEEIGLPVVMKIDSPNIVHKSDTGGVRLNLRSLAAVRSTYQEILDEVKRVQPDAVINGIAIEPMIQKRNGRELVVGVLPRPGVRPGDHLRRRRQPGRGQPRHRRRPAAAQQLPGQGHDQVDPHRDPLGEFRNMPAINMNRARAGAAAHLRDGLRAAVDHRDGDQPADRRRERRGGGRRQHHVDNVSPTADRYDHMAIHPYPSHLISTWTVPDGTTVTIRPIKPEDAELEVEFVRRLSAETKYYRFMNTMRELPPAMVARLTQIDYDREMAFVATLEVDGVENEIGVCRYAVNPDGESCEFAVVVADDWQHRGLAAS
jgi:acetyltransferase